MTYHSQTMKNIDQAMLDIVWEKIPIHTQRKNIRVIIYLPIYQSSTSLKNMKAWGNIFQELKSK